jgi:hypothetical protein
VPPTSLPEYSTLPGGLVPIVETAPVPVVDILSEDFADIQITSTSRSRTLTNYDFREEGYIGSGGWGFVHLSRHCGTGTQVAIKSVQKEKVAGKENNVLNEQATLCAVAGQKGVLDLLASFHDDGYFHFVTVSIPSSPC